jgi:uncharacterized protein (TIRG00374 family)
LSPAIKNVLKFLLFLGIGVALVYLIVRKITPEEWQNIKLAALNANYFWVIASLVLSALSHLLRALRWRLLIEPIDKKPGITNTFFAVIIGYMASYAIPRLGEVSRCGVLSKYEKITFAGLVGTVIVERVVDLIMMFLFFLVMIVMNLNSKVYTIVQAKASAFLGDKWTSIQHSNPVVLIVVAVILIGGAWFLYKKKDHLFGFAKKFINNFLGGIKSVGHLKSPLLFWVYSLAIWILYLLVAYVCFNCLAESSHLTLSDALIVLIFGTVGVIVPTPGGMGAYQYLVKSVLVSVLLISSSNAFTFAWISWGSQLILIVFLGLISLILLPIINKDDKTGVHTV